MRLERRKCCGSQNAPIVRLGEAFRARRVLRALPVRRPRRSSGSPGNSVLARGQLHVPICGRWEGELTIDHVVHRWRAWSSYLGHLVALLQPDAIEEGDKPRFRPPMKQSASRSGPHSSITSPSCTWKAQVKEDVADVPPYFARCSHRSGGHLGVSAMGTPHGT